MANEESRDRVRPLFAEGERIEYAGVFLAAALLGLDPYLETAGKLFAQAISGFYGSGERPPEVVYLDGRVQVYSGAVQIGQVYAPARKSVVKGRTETWANQPGGQPLFVLQTSFNEGLCKTMVPLLPKLVEITKGRSLTCVFDRGGYDGRLFETLLAEGHHLLTYRKGRFARADESCFEKRPTRIGERVYSYAPYEREAKLPVYEEKSRAKGRAYRRKTKRVVTLREIMVRREDGGQASILSSLRLEPGRLVVRLGPQASPNRTRAINALAAAVTGLRLKYPGSSRVIAFGPAPLR
jgi:hypothetical protein